MTELEKMYLEKLEKRILEIGVSNEFLVSLLKLTELYLSLESINDFSKKYGITTQGIRKSNKHKKNIIKICNYQVIIDN
jgi:hypothetical protein